MYFSASWINNLNLFPVLILFFINCPQLARSENFKMMQNTHKILFKATWNVNLNSKSGHTYRIWNQATVVKLKGFSNSALNLVSKNGELCGINYKNIKINTVEGLISFKIYTDWDAIPTGERRMLVQLRGKEKENFGIFSKFVNKSLLLAIRIKNENENLQFIISRACNRKIINIGMQVAAARIFNIFSRGRAQV